MELEAQLLKAEQAHVSDLNDDRKAEVYEHLLEEASRYRGRFPEWYAEAIRRYGFSPH